MLQSLLISNFAGPVIRHAGTVISGYLVATGLADEQVAVQVSGGFVGLASILLSFMEKQIRA